MHPLAITLDRRTWFCFWQEGEDGGAGDLVVAESGRIVAFASLDELTSRAAEAGTSLATAPNDGIVDLDAVEHWMTDGAAPDPVLLLGAWNLFGDVAAGTGRRWSDRSDELDDLYERLFWGNNLPAVTPVGQRFDPTWSDDDLDALRHVMQRGLRLVRSSLAE